MVAVKNGTFIGRVPPTTKFPSYPTTGGTDAYYPKGNVGLAADETAAEPPPDPTPPVEPPAPEPTPEPPPETTP